MMDKETIFKRAPLVLQIATFLVLVVASWNGLSNVFNAVSGWMAALATSLIAAVPVDTLLALSRVVTGALAIWLCYRAVREVFMYVKELSGSIDALVVAVADRSAKADAKLTLLAMAIRYTASKEDLNKFIEVSRDVLGDLGATTPTSLVKDSMKEMLEDLEHPSDD